MKISMKGRYALRMMIDLAIYGEEDNVSIKSIAQRHDMSDKYLEQIINQLVKARYVISTRGANGGYRLSRPARDYTVGMILRQVEGTLSPVPCLDCDENECDKVDDCVTLDIWKQLKTAIDNVVDSLTLDDLKHRELQHKADRAKKLKKASEAE